MNAMVETYPVKPPEDLEGWYVRSSYQSFVRSEEAPLYEGSAIEDLNALELADWKRRGGRVAYTRLADQENLTLQIVEIPPGGELKPEHHMYDATMLVIKGIGITNIWQPGERPQTWSGTRAHSWPSRSTPGIRSSTRPGRSHVASFLAETWGR